MKKFFVTNIVAAMFVSIGFGAAAYAHVTVKPAEVATASYQTFTVSVPNEKTIPTVKVKLDIPSGVTGVTPTVKPGWQIATEKSGEGESAKVTSITWSGGEVPEGMRDEFTYSAKTPDQAGKLEWKAYQTYSDGVVVAWDRAESSHGHDDATNTGPFSVTNVSGEPGSDSHSHDDATSGENDDKVGGSSWALYTAIAALLVSFGALFLSLRSK